MLLAASGAAVAKLAPHKAPGRAKTEASAAQSPAVQEAPPTAAVSACSKRLREIAEFTPLPDRAGPGECGASDRVQLDAVHMPDGSRVKITPAATLRCAMAESIAEWVRADLGKAASDHGSPLRAMMTATSYDCRPRNGIKGAKISEHGRGNAVDIAGLKLANGTVIDLTRPEASKELRDKARAGACSRFTTVLGPGADAHHENHIHVDLAVRSRGYRMCQWEVREPAVASANTLAKTPAKTPAAAPPEARPSRVAQTARSLLRAVSTKLRGRAQTEDVPLPLRRPFEMMFAERRSRDR
jgi:hypothetical protein